MLRDWPCHLLYQESLLLNLTLFFLTDRERVVELDKSISKLYLLNLDKLLPIIKPLYSNTGRSAKNQQGIIRSLVLMLSMTCPLGPPRSPLISCSAPSAGFSLAALRLSALIMILRNGSGWLLKRHLR
jgi:hypothetical protein